MPTEFPEIRLPLPLTSPMTLLDALPKIHPASVVAEIDVAGHVGADVIADDLVGAARRVDMDAVTGRFRR